MKLEYAVKHVAEQLIIKHFVSMNDCGLLYRHSFRTHDLVTTMNVQDMLDNHLTNVVDKPNIVVNIIDFFYRESCEWWCSNIILCCIPLATCKAFDTFCTLVSGPYYQIEVWKLSCAIR